MLGLAGCDLGIQVGRVSSDGATTGQEVNLSTQSGATTINAADPNPCEVDLDFGNVPIGLSDSAVVGVLNTGTEPLDLSANGTLATGIQPELLARLKSVPAGGAGHFTVTFEPFEAGLEFSTLTISTNDVNPSCPAAPGATGSALTVKLTGTGIDLSLVVEPSTFDFGNILLNTTGKASVMLINKSTAPVNTIAASVIGSDASLFVVDNCPDGPGRRCLGDGEHQLLAARARDPVDRLGRLFGTGWREGNPDPLRRAGGARPDVGAQSDQLRLRGARADSPGCRLHPGHESIQRAGDDHGHLGV